MFIKYYGFYRNSNFFFNDMLFVYVIYLNYIIVVINRIGKNGFGNEFSWILVGGEVCECRREEDISFECLLCYGC